MQADASAILNHLLARESASLLQYVHEAWPWTAPGADDALTALRRMIAEEQKAIGRLADLVTRRRLVPLNAHFPERFTAVNYTALDHLLPRLVTYQRWAIAELEKDLANLSGDEEGQALVQQTLEMKRRHLAELEKLAAQYSGEKAVSTLR